MKDRKHKLLLNSVIPIFLNFDYNSVVAKFATTASDNKKYDPV